MTSRGVIEYGLEEEDTKAGTLLIDQGIQSLGKEGLTWSIGCREQRLGGEMAGTLYV